MTQLSRFTQENALTLLTFDITNFSLARSIITADLFDHPYKTIVERVLDFIDKYNLPPYEMVADLVEKELADQKEGQKYQNILNSLFNSKDNFNGKYVLDQLVAFVKRQKFENALTKAFNLNREGKIEEAEKEIDESRNFNISIFDPGLRLSDVEAGFSSKEQVDPIPIGIPDLDRRDLCPCKKQILVFLAGKNKGKSQFLVHVGKYAVRGGFKVVHVTLELPRGQIYHRYVQAILGLTKDREESMVYSAIINRDGNGKFKSIDQEQIYPESLDDYNIVNVIKERFKRIGPELDNLYIPEFPSRDLTPEGLEGYLDFLEKRENFLPDIVLVDYADLLKFDTAQYRIEVGLVYQKLRRIASKRNLAIVTASQLNKVGMKAKTADVTDAAEDISKIFTADTVYVLSKTKAEEKYNRARLYVTSRVAKAQFSLLLAQNCDTMQFCLDSIRLPNEYNFKLKDDSSSDSDNDESKLDEDNRIL